MERIPESGTLKMFDLANRLESEGKTIYHFEVGQPDFPTPPNIIEAAKASLDRGETRYVSARGIPPLLDAIQDSYAGRGVTIDGYRNIIVTPGAKMSLFQGLFGTIDAGDDVLVLAPAWPTYRTLIRIAGGKPVDVHTLPGYNLDEEALKARVSKHVSAMVINSPNNPTGGVLKKAHLKLIYDLAEDNDFVVFSDEIYESLVYDGFKQNSMLEIDPCMERTLVISGFSKSHAMTGWRLGYAIGNSETISNMVRIQQNTTSCATSFVQFAGVEAIRGDQTALENMKAAYQERRDRIQELFCEMDGVECMIPKGAFYVFPDFSELGLSSSTLSELLLKKTGVTTAPGKVFGEAYDYHLRFSYSASLEVIEEGFAKMAPFIETLR